MGGLRKKLPVTFYTMLLGALAISGVPVLSGFSSKESILTEALSLGYFSQSAHVALPILAFLTSGLTALYMFRLLLLVFAGAPESKELADKAQERSWALRAPLVIFAILTPALWYTGSLTGGLLGDQDFILGGANNWLMNLVSSGARAAGAPDAHLIAVAISLALTAIAIAVAYMLYGPSRKTAEQKTFSPIAQRAVESGLFIETFYIEFFVKRIVLPLSRALARFDNLIIDRGLVDGWKDLTGYIKKATGLFDDIVVDGILVDTVGGGAPTLLGAGIRRLQNGRVQRYVLLALLGLVLFVLIQGVFI
jgi:NADH-quinone oxidoreductase subunit L